MSERKGKRKIKRKPEMMAGMKGDVLYLDGQAIQPGEQQIIGMRVGTLPSDTRIYINAFVFRSENPGPVVLILAGMHGDEINGVEIIRRTLKDGMYNDLASGTVIAIPLLNVYGFINFSRDLPDGKDVNRSFPGNSRGSLASRMAHILSRKILPAVNCIIDFHTGGASRYNYPQVRFTGSSAESFELAKTFGAPFILKKPVIRNSLRKIAGSSGIPIIVYEGGEALRLEGHATSKGYQGISNTLKVLGVLDGEPRQPQQPPVLITKSSWLRASTSGLFTWTVQSGMPVKKGQPLGQITDPYNSRHTQVLAHHSGYVIGHNNAPVVNLGDALFAIGYRYESL